jgi:wobble nucleotide-excising tRNase
MPSDSFLDLPTLAAHLREKLVAKQFVLLYAYNGTGKTRLSSAFKDIGKEVDDAGTTTERDTLYFNAYTEDLFQWDNDLTGDRHRFLKLNVKSRFFDGLASTELDTRIRALLDRYADFDFRIDSETDGDGRLTKAEVVFLREAETEAADGDDAEETYGIKISRGEESVFIWCFFLAILQLTLDGSEDYKWVKHVFIDDPVSSLDEHNAIVVGNHLVQLYRGAKRKIPTVISTHHALFFNVLHYEIKNHFRDQQLQYMLKRDKSSGTYRLDLQRADTPQFYHVSALAELWQVAEEETVSTYHFNVLRSILEKTAFFHGYTHFSSCIKKDADDADGILHQRFVDILSHGKYSMYEPVEMQEQTREYFRAILQGFVERHPFNPKLFGTENE